MSGEDLTYYGAVPVDACANANGVPRIPRLIRLVELVGPTDITLGRVPNEIGWESIPCVSFRHCCRSRVANWKVPN
jgi:hypothetical protein